MTEFKSTHLIEVRFRDIDAMGHVNNAVYFSYFEQARMKFFAETIGKWEWDKHGVLLAHNEIDYHAPVLLNDLVEVETFCLNMGKKSLNFGYDVFVTRDHMRFKAASGSSVLVCFDYVEQKTIAIPNQWREALGV